MRGPRQFGRLGALVVLGIAALEVVIMISPFAGFFYTTLQFEPILGGLSGSPLTAWLDGFFLNHSLVTTSLALEWHRKLGVVLIVVGLGGFFVSVVQVYGNKITRRGVARGLLYRIVRHPQYLGLGVAGYGLLTQWPRFLLLAVWVTMLFLYAGLARFEERRMAERFGDDYRRYAPARGAFLPGSPVRRLFEATFGRLGPRALGWLAAYAFCLALAFSVGFGLRAWTLASVALRFEPEEAAVVLSVWPKPDRWLADVFRAALGSAEVRQRLGEARGGKPLVVTVLPPRYGMTGMYYKAPAGPHGRSQGRGPEMGVEPDRVAEPVELVFSRAGKPYRADLTLAEALDVDVRLTPVLVVNVLPATGEVTGLRIPPPQNAWGPRVAMPIF